MIHESTERLHNLARGAFELCKKINNVIFVLEILPGIAALIQTCIDVKFLDQPWIALIAMSLALFGLLLRILGRYYRTTADSMRRTSVRFYAYDKPVPQTTLTNFLSGLPRGVETSAKKLPVENIDEYYETTLPPGIGRYREMTACNSFFTWNLQKMYSWILGFIFVILLAISVCILYGIATSQLSLLQRLSIADLVYTVIIGMFLFKSINGFFATLFSIFDLKTVANKIMNPNLSDDEILHQIIEYECAGGPLVPTRLYRMRRKRLNALWDLRRKDLEKIYGLDGA